MQGEDTSAPTPAFTPTLAAEFDPLNVHWIRGRPYLTGRVTNQSGKAITGLRIALESSDDGSMTSQRERLTPLLPWLPAGASAPFQIELEAGDDASAWSPRVLGYQLSELSPAPTSVDVVAHHLDEEGRSRIVGWIEADSDDPLRLDGLAFAGQRDQNLLANQKTIAPAFLLPGEPSAFEATFPDQIDPDSLEVFSVAHRLDVAPLNGLELSGPIELRYDAQANPFLIGTLRNDSQVALSARLLFPITVEDRLVRVMALDTRIPLSPGEQRSLGLRLRGLPQRADGEELGVSAVLEAGSATSEERSTLVLDIGSIELTGSSVFLKGSVHNPSDPLALDPTIFAAMRNLEGELLTAAWLALPSALPAEETQGFVLEVPIPADTEIAEGEWDITALARYSAEDE